MPETRPVAGEDADLIDRTLQYLVMSQEGRLLDENGRWIPRRQVLANLYAAAFERGVEWQREEGFREGRP